MTPNIYLPQLSKINKYLIMVFGGLFLLESILISSGAGVSLKETTNLVWTRFFSGHIYQLLTYPLVANGIFEVLFDGLVLWFIGSELEFMWGRIRYIGFLLIVVLGGGGLFLLSIFLFSKTGIPTTFFSGPSGMTTALCVAFGVLFPNRVMFFFFFPLKAKYLVMIIVGMVLYGGFFSPGMAAWGILGSCLSAFLWTRNPLPWTSFWLFRLGRLRNFFSSKDKKGRHLTLVPQDFDNNDDSDGNITYH